MLVSSRLSGVILMGALLAGCSTTQPQVPVEAAPVFVDPTPPKVRLGSEKFRKNFQLDQDSAEGVDIRLRSTDRIELVAVGADPDTGMRQIGLQGEIRVTCRSTDGASRVLVEPVDDLAVPEFFEDNAPARLVKVRRFSLDVGVERSKCAPGRFVAMAASLKAVAVNGQDMTRESAVSRFWAFGPDQLTVGLLNVQGELGHLDSDYLRWGAVLGQTVDVLILNGVPDRRRADLVATMAGLPHVAVLQEQDTDVAILSRAPLGEVNRQQITPAGQLPARVSTLLGVDALFEHYPLRLIAAHFSPLDAQDQYVGPETSSLSRFLAAEAILEMLPEAPQQAIVGGTLNAYSGVGPQTHPGIGTEEITLLSERLLDAFAWLKRPNGAHCSEQRVDYLMSTPHYVATRYEACFSEAEPSTHPFVRVTFAVP